MNYDQPRQLQNGRWHYTTHNRRVGTYAIGYCADHEPHATEDEARECYASYLLNERLRLDGQMEAYFPCQIDGCGALTNSVVSIDGWATSYRLCDEHRTKEQVAALYGRFAGDSVHS
jgi:hypothetical protein